MKILRYILVSAMLAIAGLAFGQQPTLMTRAIVTSNEIVGANAVPVTAFEVTSTSTASPRGILSSQYTTDALGARLGFMKARGTRAVPLTIVSGDNIGRLNAWPYDGANYLEMVSIIFGTEGTIATTRTPTNIQFWTGTDAAPSVLTLAGSFDSGQNFTVTNKTTAGAYAISSGAVNAQTGTTYTLLATDNGKVVTLNNAGAITLTVPSGLGAGFSCVLIQLGAGQVSLTMTGTVLRNIASATKIAGQYGQASLTAYVADNFAFSGDVTP